MGRQAFDLIQQHYIGGMARLKLAKEFSHANRVTDCRAQYVPGVASVLSRKRSAMDQHVGVPVRYDDYVAAQTSCVHTSYECPPTKS